MTLLSSPIYALVGGILAWLVAAFMDYISHSSKYEDRLDYYRSAGKSNLAFAEMFGDPEQAAAKDVGGSAPTLSASISRSYHQPLFICILTGGVVGIADNSDTGGIKAIFYIILIVLSILLALAAEMRTSMAAKVQRLGVSIAAWGITSIFIVLLTVC